MTGGVGFSSDAMNSGRSNRSKRASNQTKFKEGYDTYLSEKEPLKFKDVSEGELAKIKAEIQENAKKERSKSLIIGLVVVALFVIAGFYLILKFSK